ncbi:MAG: hypothetical protein FWD74_11535 [Actinomycetia bacterium]|nr:hypothetical protein [Actinomycetes bacterium]
MIAIDAAREQVAAPPADLARHGRMGRPEAAAPERIGALLNRHRTASGQRSSENPRDEQRATGGE